MMDLVQRSSWLELNWKVHLCPFWFHKSHSCDFSTSPSFCHSLSNAETHTHSSTNTHTNTHNSISLEYTKEIFFFWLTEGFTVALKATPLPWGGVETKMCANICVCVCVCMCVCVCVCVCMCVYENKLTSRCPCSLQSSWSHSVL